jgi:hypothetical protein
VCVRERERKRERERICMFDRVGEVERLCVCVCECVCACVCVIEIERERERKREKGLDVNEPLKMNEREQLCFEVRACNNWVRILK